MQVVTEDGQELARVSIIDYNSGVNIYDKFVKPAKPVIDYRTQSVFVSDLAKYADDQVVRNYSGQSCWSYAYACFGSS